MSGLRAEWTKLRTLPSNLWLLVGMVGGFVALSVIMTVGVNADQCPAPDQCFKDPTRLALSGVHAGQVIAVALAGLAVAAEYGTGMIRTTFLAMPNRGRLFAAKACAVIVPVMVSGLLGVALALALARPNLRRQGFAKLPDLTDAAVLRAAGGTVLYLGLIALLSLGMAALVRDAAAATGAVIGLLYLPPLIGRFIEDRHQLIDKVAPLNAGLSIQGTISVAAQPVGPWAGLGVLALWAVALAGAGIVTFVRRDP